MEVKIVENLQNQRWTTLHLTLSRIM